jgi:hypothetical protein
LAALFAVACGDGPNSPPTAPPTEAGTAEPIPGLPVLGAAIQDLEFIGTVEGHMTDSSASCAWFHGTNQGDGRLQLAFDGLVGSERHRLRIVVNGYSGPGSYSWDGPPSAGPEVTAEVDGTQTGHVTINVNEPGGTGDMEVTLTSPNQGRIHGVWECPGVPR